MLNFLYALFYHAVHLDGKGGVPMSVLGIVAEYDPFHNGHLHHLRSSVSAVSPSAVLAVISGPFRQRGTLSLLSPFARAECAVAAGVDAVFSLPVLWTLRDAEHYALGAVSLLSSLGATHISFGAETADLFLLQTTADLLEDPPSMFQETLHAALADGAGYPAAVTSAARACNPEAGALLRHPNNILAVSYLRAIRRLSSHLIPVVIPRTGGYVSDRVFPDAPSASSVAEALRRGDWADALTALPPFSRQIVRSDFLSGTIPDLRKLDILLLEKLRSLCPEEVAALPDCAEGLNASLLKSAVHASSRDDLILRLTSRRYASARISRLCAYALLDITKKDIEEEPLPYRALLLAMKKNPSLTGSWKSGSVQVLTVAKWLKNASPADLAAWRIWSLCCGKTDAWPFEKKLITNC